ncbi:RDD family protein [Nocardia sp. alder85J]|uniref:RDD family protein n=1 Tax=Nocardia sp. alder85J TaxID=2862949 RepID=UPI001CD21ECD|nr:RDD family protein [Nocardia sp. alder85J]MCX4091318.1 RDD family protein [Nocardia sp. alder85J]
MSNPSDPNDPNAAAPQYGQQPPPGYGYPPPPPPGYGNSGGWSQPGYPTAQPPYGSPQDSGAQPIQPPPYGGQPYPGQQPYGGQPGYGGTPGYGAAPQPGYPTPPPTYGYPPSGGGYTPYGAPALPYASWLQRVGARLIDGLAAFVPAAVLYGIGFGIGSSSMSCSTDSDGVYQCSGGGLSAIGLIFVLLGWLTALGIGIYLIYKEGTTGQTWGKRVLGISLIREADGQFLGFGMAFVRQLAHFLDGIACYIGYLWPLWDEKRQTFADKVCSTLVVKTNP